jgi:hypothetical protein
MSKQTKFGRKGRVNYRDNRNDQNVRTRKVGRVAAACAPTLEGAQPAGGDAFGPAEASDRHRQLRTYFQMIFTEALPVTSGCKLLLLGEGSLQLECFLDRIEQLGGGWVRHIRLSISIHD